jgi:hypothetical protein
MSDLALKSVPSVTHKTVPAALTTEEKLRLRLAKLPAYRMITFVVVTGEQGEIVAYSEMGEGKAQT